MADHFQGQIVLVQIPDPDGHPCDGPQNAVIVTKSNLLDTRDFFHVVGISTKFVESTKPPHWIKLPWDNGGHVKTGLSEPCVAKCNWVCPVEKSQIIKPTGALHDIRLREIIDWIRKLAAT